jgi:hypothetical protein
VKDRTLLVMIGLAVLGYLAYRKTEEDTVTIPTNTPTVDALIEVMARNHPEELHRFTKDKSKGPHPDYTYADQLRITLYGDFDTAVRIIWEGNPYRSGQGYSEARKAEKLQYIRKELAIQRGLAADFDRGIIDFKELKDGTAFMDTEWWT